MKTLFNSKQSITSEEIESVAKSLQNECIARGPEVLEFEKAFAYIASRIHRQDRGILAGKLQVQRRFHGPHWETN